jgi:hypothetical protein
MGFMKPGRESISIALINTRASKRIGNPFGGFLSAPSGKTIPLNNLQKVRGYAVLLTMPEQVEVGCVPIKTIFLP